MDPRQICLQFWGPYVSKCYDYDRSTVLDPYIACGYDTLLKWKG
jgi:hypothetical protein